MEIRTTPIVEPAAVPARDGEETLDTVYSRYADQDPFLPNGFVEHATMGPEAMVALGIGDRVEGWLAYHPVRAVFLPRTGEPIEARWQDALGKRERHGDWLEYFEDELANTPYTEVLATWVPRFLPDIAARLFHGLIRTAQAVRALEHRNTLARRHELASGLALWASGVDLAHVMGSRRRHVDDAPASCVLWHARSGAESFLHVPNVPMLHLVTAPMAYALMASHLTPYCHGLADAAFAQTHAMMPARLSKLPQPLFDGASFDPRFLTPLAEVPDAHPAKLTEACVRAFAESHDEIFLDAAAKVQPNQVPRHGHAAH